MTIPEQAVALLPCPFCDSAPAVAGATIFCGNDECFGPQTTAGTLQSSAEQWNTRSAQSLAGVQRPEDVARDFEEAREFVRNLWRNNEIGKDQHYEIIARIDDLEKSVLALPHTGQPQEGEGGTEVTVGLGLVDIGPIKYEGRHGVLIRPRETHIPFGEPGELQNTMYWPRQGDVVIWVEGDGPQILVTELSAYLSPAPQAGCATEGCDWVIRKNGYFYRPNKAGYTATIFEAGRYTEQDAKLEAEITESITAHPASDFASPPPPVAESGWQQEPGIRQRVIRILWEKQFEGSPWRMKFHLIRPDSLEADYGTLADKIIGAVRADIEECFELTDRRAPAPPHIAEKREKL